MSLMLTCHQYVNIMSTHSNTITRLNESFIYEKESNEQIFDNDIHKYLVSVHN